MTSHGEVPGVAGFSWWIQFMVQDNHSGDLTAFCYATYRTIWGPTVLSIVRELSLSN